MSVHWYRFFAVLAVCAAPAVAQNPPSLLTSSSADRSEPAPLDGAVVSGAIYAFVPESGVSRVRFFLDNPAMTGTPYKTENRAPFDLAGTAANDDALPFDTTGLPDGVHQVTAALTLSGGGSQVLTAAFVVNNDAPALMFTPATIGLAVDAGQGDAQTVEVAATDGSAVDFALSSDSAWLSAVPVTGTTPQAVSIEVDAAGLENGLHTGKIEALAAGHGPAVLQVSLIVGSEVDQVHLAWVHDPATTITVVWRTLDAQAPSQAQYRPAGADDWQTATGGVRPSGAAGALHEVELTGLSPSTAYEYRVLGDGGEWSEVFTTRTAPPADPGDFDFIYVADTGIIGRLDGLATGTEQVIAEIAALQPLLVLLGGDYAYYNTDQRFGTLDNTIDAWFRQMAPVATRSIMMPTYGNHEVKLGEGFPPWAQRFPTPQGFDSRRYYSFDVADVHFISILAVEDHLGISSAALNWIEQDIIAAQAAGQRWIIPFMHAPPYSDGSNHPQNLALRAQLAPLFEAYGVQVALTSHDQAYERSYPLVDAPDVNTPTSLSTSCYDGGDGVVWVKVSPGGKISNINSSFSQFLHAAPPSWTAYRDNSAHHFCRVQVLQSGRLVVSSYAVTGDGSPPVIDDQFEIHLEEGTCPPELVFGAEYIAMEAAQGQSANAAVTLVSSDAAPAEFSVAVLEPASWLTVSPGAAVTPASLVLTADASELAEGVYTATVVAESPGSHAADSLEVMLEVREDAFTILVSASTNRQGAVALHGQAVSGDVFAFTDPEEGVLRVRFFIDNPQMAGSPYRTENSAPYDLAGGTAGAANPFATTQLADGPHTLTAAIELSAGGTEVVHAAFTVVNAAPALRAEPPALSFALQPDESASAVVGLSSTTAEAAEFTLTSSASWLTATPMSGLTPASLQITADSAGLSPGSHTATLTAAAPGFTPVAIPVTLQVAGGAADTYALLLSGSSNRSAPAPLQGSVLSGDVFIFTSPDAGVSRVRFYIDDPARSGSPYRNENSAPYDLAGGTANTASPFDTGDLADGPHVLTAALELAGGGLQVIHADFTVANSAPGLIFTPAALSFNLQEGQTAAAQVDLETTHAEPAEFTLSGVPPWLTLEPSGGAAPLSLSATVDAAGLSPGTHSAIVTASAPGLAPATLAVTLTIALDDFTLLVSHAPDRSAPSPLDGAMVGGNIFVFTSPDTGVNRVRFYIDDPARSAPPYRTENSAPFDLAGGTVTTASPFNTATLASGPHTITAELRLADGGTVIVTATLTVEP